MRPAHYWVIQLRIAPTGAPKPALTMSSGRVQPGVSEYCRSAQLRAALAGASLFADTLVG